MESRGALVMLFIVVFCREEASTAVDIHYIQTPMNWTDAQQHCRDNFFDLISFSIPKLLQDFISSSIWRELRNEKPWIGIFRQSGSQDWMWSDSGDKLRNEMLTNLNTDNGQSDLCVVVRQAGTFKARDCAEPRPFLCQQIAWRNGLVLTKMTWNDALDHCREHYSDMASLLSQKNYNDMASTLSDEQLQEIQRSASAWIGLRYVVRHWLWVNGDALEYLAWAEGKQPQCPVAGEYCGALSTREEGWVNMDCEQKLFFFCRY